ncbi:hypothetical protein [Kitasatospora indigofera]|uniref:hypothetical protein n=1 Tax=Kitasatospora indigofera TaxID=67307 RepID=UPI0033BF720B
MSHTTEYDSPTGTAVRHTVSAPADRHGHTDTAVSNADRTDTPHSLSGWAVFLLGAIFAVMGIVGAAGAYGTYRNMQGAFHDSGTALGLVAAGEGATAVLGLTLIGLTLISRPYPLAFRLGLWLIPIVGSVAGWVVAEDDRHAAVYAITPLAMTAAAELAGYLARSIVVHRTGTDAEAARRTGETLRLIEFHQARAQHHPSTSTRQRSEKAAWRLAKRLGRDDPALGSALSAAYAHRTTTAAVAALDTLYGRTDTADTAPAAVPLPVAPATPLPALSAPLQQPAPEPAPVIDTAPEETVLVVPQQPTHPVPDVEETPLAVEPEPTPAAEHAPTEVPGQLPFDAFDTDQDDTEAPADTADTDDEIVPGSVPKPGVRLTDVELDAVVHMIRTETDPPLSYRDMETRFRDGRYIAGAARLRAAWERVTAGDPAALEG